MRTYVGDGTLRRDAIVHIDADAFFVSCHEAVEPALRGKPAVTGGERGVASAVSYAARAIGVVRGMPIARVRREFPDCIVLASDYALYASMSARMLAILSEFFPRIERYSIDECFTAVHGDALEQAALLDEARRAIVQQLGITVSCGAAPTKTLAKIVSSRAKPNGSMVMRASSREALLADTPVRAVWGIGRRTAERLVGHGIRTAFGLARAEYDWLRRRFSRPVHDVWHELNGVPIIPIVPDRGNRLSVRRSRTFTPSSRRAMVLAELLSNADSACAVLRREGLAATEMRIWLRRDDGVIMPSRTLHVNAIRTPLDCACELERLFDEVYRFETAYRTTGITFSGIEPACVPLSLPTSGKRTRTNELFGAVDTLRKRYGRVAVSLASSLPALRTDRRHGVIRTFGSVS